MFLAYGDGERPFHKTSIVLASWRSDDKVIYDKIHYRHDNEKWIWRMINIKKYSNLRSNVKSEYTNFSYESETKKQMDLIIQKYLYVKVYKTTWPSFCKERGFVVRIASGYKSHICR